MDAQSLGHVTIIVFLILGNIGLLCCQETKAARNLLKGGHEMTVEQLGNISASICIIMAWSYLWKEDNPYIT